MGTARVWMTPDGKNGGMKPRTLRECPGIPQGALSYARRCMALFGDQLASKTHVIIGDFSTDANFVRLHVLQWDQADPENSVPILRGGLVHGEGNLPPTVTGVATVVKDAWNSNATPGGCMRLFGTGNEATLQSVAQNLQAYRLDGLEERNACTDARGIFFHESYLAEDGYDKVKTQRYEERDARDPNSADMSRIRVGRNLGTALTPGCITASNDDFDFIKAKNIVPAPGPGWRPTNPPRPKEGILFISWFWGDLDQQELVARDYRTPRDCRDQSKAVMTPAIPKRDPNIPALRELERLQSLDGMARW